MLRDISSKDDIHAVITKFYERLIEDEKMLPFFKSIIENGELQEHLNTITLFWEDLLFDTSNYGNNVLKKHLDFNEKLAFTKAHFEQWLLYFKESISDSFTGEKAQKMQERADSIAMVMQLKMELYD